MTGSDEKSIRVIEFSGKPSDWKIWSRKFLARANRKGYKALLEGKIAIPTLAEYEAAVNDPRGTDRKEKIKLWKLNEVAFEEILLSINGQTKPGRIAFSLVDNCVSDDQPEGNCKVAWERLVHKYSPKTAPSYIQLKKNFANSKLLSVGANPEEWITDLESMRSEMNKVSISGKTDMSEVDLIIHILSNLPEEYEVAVSELEEKLKDTSNPLDMETVRDKLNCRYERIAKNAETAEEEIALAAFMKEYKSSKENDTKDCQDDTNESKKNDDGSGNWKGIKCWKCGEHGHKKSDCPKNKNETAMLAKYESDSENESIAEFGFCARDARVACDIETLEASNTLEYTTKPDQIRSDDTEKVCDIVRNDDCDGRDDTDKYHGTYDVDVSHDCGRCYKAADCDSEAHTLEYNCNENSESSDMRKSTENTSTNDGQVLKSIYKNKFVCCPSDDMRRSDIFFKSTEIKWKDKLALYDEYGKYKKKYHIRKGLV